MSTVPEDLRYTKDHEWIRAEDGTATVGITDHAQDALSDVTFVDLPEVGAEVTQGEEAAAVESCKAAADVYAPASGTVLEVNETLRDAPGQVNADPYGDGWLFTIELSHPEEVESLKSPAEYRALLAKEE